MGVPLFHFGDQLTRQQFLDEYWQQRPVLLRSAIDPACCDLTPDELAGLACEEEIESRLIEQLPDDGWSLRHGPFGNQDFAQLPDAQWTLLVQDVDKHVPEVAGLLDAFDFLPDWRIDDIMISYAADEGGVGPHTDNYDVFLIQTMGQRRWRISDREHTEQDLLADCPLRVLRHFDTRQDWVLNPGDVLYLPPGIAHWGTAIGDCMTWSVGMRGASDIELVAAWLECPPLHEGRPHLGDNINSKTTAPSRIGALEVERARAIMRNALPDDTPEFRRWLGAYLTEPKPGLEIDPVGDVDTVKLEHWWSGEGTLHRHPWARFALVEFDDGIALCAQGEVIQASPATSGILERICRHRTLVAENLGDADFDLADQILRKLLQRGWLYHGA